MTEQDRKELGRLLWEIANKLRGSMDADDFRDYMLAFLFLKHISNNYQKIAEINLKDELKDKNGKPLTLQSWYKNNQDKVKRFEEIIKKKTLYLIKPEYLWSNIAELAKKGDKDTLDLLRKGFKYIQEDSFEDSFDGLFSEINLESDKLGKIYEERNELVCRIINQIETDLKNFSQDVDTLGDAYEYLIAQFASNSGKSAGEFYTPQQISNILSSIVVLDSQDPTKDRTELTNVLDFACGSGSLILNVSKKMKNKGYTIGKIYGQEKNITTYNLARMNMLLHGVKTNEFEIYHGDTLKNTWHCFKDNHINKIEFDAIVANPPFSLKWDSNKDLESDFRFSKYGLAPKSAADFAFLLHGFNYLKKDGTMAIILPHGVLFRGGAEGKIRKKLLEENSIDTIIGLPANLFYSTGIPVCVLVLKKCKKHDDVLFIDASQEFEKNKRQNSLNEEHIKKIINTYKNRKDLNRYSRKVELKEIEENDYNLNISRYIDTSEPEEQIDLNATITSINTLFTEEKTLIDEINLLAKGLQDENGNTLPLLNPNNKN